MDVVILIASLGIILLSAELFTNGVEWLGKKLHLSEGAVGSVLAAVGTALPETMIPIIAILFSGGVDEHVAEEIGIGAILGAPFMLSTLALFITGIAAVSFKHNGVYRTQMLIDPEVMTRDQIFFLIVYTLAILAAFIPTHALKLVVAAFLVGAYIVYVIRTLQGSKSHEDEELNPLYFARKAHDPATAMVLVQVLVALAGIVTGAKLFVGSVEHLAHAFGVPAFVLSIIIAPIATELPEKFNSIIWVGKGKDTLALGNITGAMVFQSSVIPALGIAMTPWKLTGLAVTSAALALVSSLFIYIGLKQRGIIRPSTLLYGGFFYSVFIFIVLGQQYGNHNLKFYSLIVLAILMAVNYAYGRRAAVIAQQRGRAV